MSIYREERLVKEKGFEEEILKIDAELKTESESEEKMSNAAGNLRESRGELNHQLKTVEEDIERAKS